MDIVLDLFLSGVDFMNFPDTGGKECLEYIRFERRCIETVVAVAIFLVSIIVGFWVSKVIPEMITRHSKGFLCQLMFLEFNNSIEF